MKPALNTRIRNAQLANFWVSAIVISTVGACVLIFIIGLFRR